MQVAQLLLRNSQSYGVVRNSRAAAMARPIPDVKLWRFAYSQIHTMFLMYSPYGINVYGSRCGELEGINQSNQNQYKSKSLQYTSVFWSLLSQ